MDIMNNIVVKPANGVDGTKGQYIEEITLTPQSFENWTETNIPDWLIRQELGKLIANHIEYDSHLLQNPRTGRPMVKNSTVVYCKPDYIALYQENETLKSQIEKERVIQNEEILKADEALTEVTADKDECLRQWVKYSDLYFEYRNKDQDWEHHVRMLFILTWRGLNNIFIFISKLNPFR